MRITVWLLTCYGILFAAPLVFDTLAEPLQKSTVTIEKLSQKPVM